VDNRKLVGWVVQMVRMSEEDLPAPAAPVGGGDVGSTSSVTAETVPSVEDPSSSPCLMTSGEVGGVGSADSDSGGSLSSSASPAPPPSTATHDEWNANEPSDGADSGVGANGSTPVDGESLSDLRWTGDHRIAGVHAVAAVRSCTVSGSAAGRASVGC